jgi:hypothetical protein
MVMNKRKAVIKSFLIKVGRLKRAKNVVEGKSLEKSEV